VKKDKRGTYWIEDEYYQTQKSDARGFDRIAGMFLTFIAGSLQSMLVII